MQDANSQTLTTQNPPSNSNETAAAAQRPENGFISIIFNIVIPVLILNKLSARLGEHGPLIALLLALSFPIGYGAYDLVKNQKKNFISLLGLINVSITGGLAVIGLSGIWFSIKEAAFPLLIGSFVFISAFRKKPIVEVMLMNPSIMNLPLIQKKLTELEAEYHFRKHLKYATILLALSFTISACLNFLIARTVFIPIDPNLDGTAKSIALNGQIAEMTYKAMLIITIPSFLSLLSILWFLIHGIKKHTGLKTSEIFVEN